MPGKDRKVGSNDGINNDVSDVAIDHLKKMKDSGPSDFLTFLHVQIL